MARKKLSARKQPRQERSAATVEAILQAAAYILTRRGWPGFTTNAVAEKAGVNIASLYQYFPNKEAIAAELQRRHARSLQQRWPAEPGGLSLDASLRAVIETVVAEHRANPALHRVLAEELPRSSRVRTAPGAEEARWIERMAPLMKVPDAGLATFITRVVVHAVIHEAASDHPGFLEHPLLVPELVRLLSPYLAGTDRSLGTPTSAARPPPPAAPPRCP